MRGFRAGAGRELTCKDRFGKIGGPELNNLHRMMCLALCCLLIPAPHAAEDTVPAELPAWLAERTRGLSEAQLEFLRSDEAEGFTGTREKLYQRPRKSPPMSMA
jgi:hypothetical protein